MERDFSLKWCPKCEGRMWHIVARYDRIKSEIVDLEQPYWYCEVCKHQELYKGTKCTPVRSKDDK